MHFNRLNNHTLTQPKTKGIIKPELLQRLPPALVMEIFDQLTLEELVHYLWKANAELRSLAARRFLQFKGVSINWPNERKYKAQFLRWLSKNVTHFGYDGAHCRRESKILSNFFKDLAENQLHRLRLNNVRIGDATLCLVLPAISALTTLDLSLSTVDDDTLSEILSQCSHLREFTMLGNSEFSGAPLWSLSMNSLLRVIVEKGRNWNLNLRRFSDYILPTAFLLLSNKRVMYWTGDFAGIYLCRARLREMEESLCYNDPASVIEKSKAKGEGADN